MVDQNTAHDLRAYGKKMGAILPTHAFALDEPKVRTPDFATGVAFDTNGNLIAASGTSLYRFLPDGTRSLAANIPGAQDLNGLTLLSPGTALVADDATATVWRVNLSTGSSSAWLSGGLLEPEQPELTDWPQRHQDLRG